MLVVKLTTIGDAVGLVLPREALARLKVENGGIVFLTETPDGYRITSREPEFEHQMELARKAMKKRNAALRALGKDRRGARPT